MDLIEKGVSYLQDLGVDFGDIRIEEHNTTSIFIVNKEIRSVSTNYQSGLSVRALVNGKWGYASTNILSFKELKRTIDVAYTSAKVTADMTRSKRFKLDAKAINAHVKANIKEDPASIDLEEKLEVLFDINKVQQNFDERIINTNTRYGETKLKVTLGNTIGSSLEWEEIRTVVTAMSLAQENGKIQYSYNISDGTYGFELIRNLNYEEFGTRPSEEAINLLSAKKPPSGNLIVIADPSISGLLAHEVMGHASEGDEIVKRRSFLTGVVGQEVASDKITMVDDGTIPGAHGTIPYDSEGTPSSRTVIIDKGVYKGYMHSLETASLLDAEPTGNGRAQDTNRRVWVRMTNTFFDKGDWSLDEMISETKSGLLAIKAISGMEDPVGGGFEGRALMGYIIENGEKKDLVRAFTLTGKALEILKTVDAVSKDFQLEGGFCGKGEEDWVPVSTGGAYIRAQIIVGGG